VPEYAQRRYNRFTRECPPADCSRGQSREGASIPPIFTKRILKQLKRLIRPLVIAVLALIVIGLAAPMINAARYSGRIREALEASLGRKVEFEKAYFNIFSGPGFSLERVVIGEDPRYGIEPFAFVPIAHARLRLDKLLLGEIQIASLQLQDPSLNLVKRADGTWNVIELMERLSTPRRMPLNFFPALEVSEGRIDFKVGLRKTVLYILDTDLSIYPERSGKVYMRFSGSPARTDRAGMGFGHIRGDVNWYLNAGANEKQLEADLSLDPSNLSEMTTLLEGQDAGVHGTVSSRLQASGPASNLAVTGSLRVNDVHRWDLLPASGEEWSVRYGGRVDLVAHSADVRTLPTPGQTSTVAIRLRVDDFLSQPRSSVIAEMKEAPIANLLPLASRLGVTLPRGADLRGVVNGALGYAQESGWSGGISVTGAEAMLPGVPALRATEADLTLTRNGVHLDPTTLATGSGRLRLSGDYTFSNQEGTAVVNALDLPLDEIKPLANSWLGGAGPLAAMSDGSVSGQLTYRHSAEMPSAPERASAWTGQLLLRDATLSVPGVTLPLQNARGRISFHDAGFDVDRFVASFGGQTVRASYRFTPLAKRSERVHVELSRADLSQLEGFLSAPEIDAGFWAKFRLGRHATAGLLQKRNLEGDLVIEQFFAEGQPLGGLSSRFVCEGSKLQVSTVRLQMAQGSVDAHGTIDLAASSPRWSFTANAANYPWGGGSLSADGEFTSAGAGKDLLRNLAAAGSFTGAGLAVSTEDTFETVTGQFQISFANGWPDLRLSNVQAVQNGDAWTGDGLTDSDGKLLINLEHGGRQLHLVSSLAGSATTPAVPMSSVPSGVDSRAGRAGGLKF
jgi:hypothetical protein